MSASSNSEGKYGVYQLTEDVEYNGDNRDIDEREESNA
jgi:hypothetical protein